MIPSHPQTYLIDSTSRILLLVVLALITLVVIVLLVRSFNRFSRELWLLNMEIGRTTGRERKYWRRRRVRLWLSLLPFVRYDY